MTYDQAVALTKNAMRAGQGITITTDDDRCCFLVKLETDAESEPTDSFEVALCYLRPIRPVAR